MISIRMVKICDDSIYKPLKLIFQSCLESGNFPSEWKKANVVPVHKQGDEKILKNYRPISLLPIIGKILRNYYMMECLSFLQKNVISDDQSGFRPSNLCINQLFKVSQWTSIETGVHQGSILEPPSFFIYISGLSEDLSRNTKLFGDDTSLFSIVRYINNSVTDFNNDLRKTNN